MISTADNKEKGWVLLYRSIRDSWVWERKPFSLGQAWIDLIMDVNHEDSKLFIDGKLVKIRRGQKWTSIRTLARRWGWRQESVLKFLRALEQDGMITRKSTKRGTLLTVVKYGFFQGGRNTSGALPGAQAEQTRSETNKDKRRTKEGRKERGLPSEGKNEDPDDDGGAWFDSLEDESEVMQSDTDGTGTD